MQATSPIGAADDCQIPVGSPICCHQSKLRRITSQNATHDPSIGPRGRTGLAARLWQAVAHLEEPEQQRQDPAGNEQQPVCQERLPRDMAHGEIPRVQVQTEVQCVPCHQLLLDCCGDHAALDGNIHIIVDPIGVVPAGKDRAGRKFFRQLHGIGKLGHIAALGCQQRNGKHLALSILRHRILDRIGPGDIHLPGEPRLPGKD